MWSGGIAALPGAARAPIDAALMDIGAKPPCVPGQQNRPGSDGIARADSNS